MNRRTFLVVLALVAVSRPRVIVRYPDNSIRVGVGPTDHGYHVVWGRPTAHELAVTA